MGPALGKHFTCIDSLILSKETDTERLNNLSKIAQLLVTKLRFEPRQSGIRLRILIIWSCPKELPNSERRVWPLLRQNPTPTSNWPHVYETHKCTHTHTSRTETRVALTSPLFPFPGSQETGLTSPTFGQALRLGRPNFSQRPPLARQRPGGGAVSLSYSGASVFWGLRAGGGKADVSRACRQFLWFEISLSSVTSFKWAWRCSPDDSLESEPKLFS